MKYLSEPWNYIDMVLIGCVFVMVSSNVLDTRLGTEAASLGSILAWLRAIYFALGFKGTGLFVRVIMQVFQDMAPARSAPGSA